MEIKIYFILFILCKREISASDQELYASIDPGPGFQQPEHCKLYGNNLNGSVLEKQLQKISVPVGLNRWTWINAVEEFSPPLVFLNCFYSQKKNTHWPVNLNITDVNPINECLSRCSDNKTIYLTDKKCYCGERGFNGTNSHTNQERHIRKCSEKHLKELKCGKNKYIFCKYQVYSFSSSIGFQVGSVLWKNLAERENDNAKCISVAKETDGRVVKESKDCKEILPYLCEGRQKSVSTEPPINTSSIPANNRSITSSTQEIERTRSSISVHNRSSKVEGTTSTTTNGILSFGSSTTKYTTGKSWIDVSNTTTSKSSKVTDNTTISEPRQAVDNTTTTVIYVLLGIFVISGIIVAIILIYRRKISMAKLNVQEASDSGNILNVINNTKGSLNYDYTYHNPNTDPHSPKSSRLSDRDINEESNNYDQALTSAQGRSETTERKFKVISEQQHDSYDHLLPESANQEGLYNGEEQPSPLKINNTESSNNQPDIHDNYYDHLQNSKFNEVETLNNSELYGCNTLKSDGQVYDHVGNISEPSNYETEPTGFNGIYSDLETSHETEITHMNNNYDSFHVLSSEGNYDTFTVNIDSDNID